MNLKGRVINIGRASGTALVLDFPFSFIGDFDPGTGSIVVEKHPLKGATVAGKILVCPTGKGGTIAPFIAYQAMQANNAPVAILCQKADPMLCECALIMDIPILDGFEQDIVKAIRTGQHVRIDTSLVMVEE